MWSTTVLEPVGSTALQQRQRLSGALPGEVAERPQRVEPNSRVQVSAACPPLPVRGHQDGIHVNNQRIHGPPAVVGRLVASQLPSQGTARTAALAAAMAVGSAGA